VTISVAIVGMLIGRALSTEWMGVLFPIAAMGGYIAYGLYFDPTNRVSIQFADSIYYQGFLFTLMGLLASLWHLSEDSQNAGALTASFAIALTTTVIGIIARTLIASFRADMEDVVARTELSLAQGATTLQGQVERLGARMASIQEHFVGAVTAISEDSREAIADLSRNTERVLGNATARFATSLEGKARTFTESLDQIATASTNQVTEAQGAIHESIMSLASATEESCRRIRESDLPQDVLTGTLGPALQALEEKIRGFGDAMEETLVGQQHVREDLARLTQDIKAVLQMNERSMGNLSSMLGDSGPLTEFQTQMRGAADTLAEIGQHLSRDAELIATEAAEFRRRNTGTVRKGGLLKTLRSKMSGGNAPK